MEPGYKYEGEYNDRYQRHGLGVASFNNGDRYEGHYENGKRGGFGVYTFANGSEYNGEWKNGKKHGLGVFTYSDKSHYDGEWCDDLRHGYGKYFYNNGDYYEGEWSNHLRHGKGKYAYAISNLIYSGTWFEGKRTGDGIVSRIGECLILTISNQKSTPEGGKSLGDSDALNGGSPLGNDYQYHLFHADTNFQVTGKSNLIRSSENIGQSTPDGLLTAHDSSTFASTGFNYHLFHSKSPFVASDLEEGNEKTKNGSALTSAHQSTVHDERSQISQKDTSEVSGGSSHKADQNSIEASKMTILDAEDTGSKSNVGDNNNSKLYAAEEELIKSIASDKDTFSKSNTAVQDVISKSNTMEQDAISKSNTMDQDAVIINNTMEQDAVIINNTMEQDASKSTEQDVVSKSNEPELDAVIKSNASENEMITGDEQI